MKPSWDDAPEWANYLAMDDSRMWHWYEELPKWDGWQWIGDGFITSAMGEDDASQSLENRP